jgi:hypothetical protein
MIGILRSIRMGGLLGSSVTALAACAAVTPAQNERNGALYTAARSCETGSLSAERVSNEGLVYTRTGNSGGNEWVPFQKCYEEKASPVWQAYCRAEPENPQCKR